MPTPAFFPRPPRGLILLVGILVTGPLRGADPIQEVGKTATEWVKTRADTVRIENAWVQDRALLASTLNGLKERADRLQEKRDYLLAATADERAEQAALSAKLADAKEKLQATEAQLQMLTEKILRLRAQLPPRLPRVPRRLR